MITVKLEFALLLGIIVCACDTGIAIANFPAMWVATLNKKRKKKHKKTKTEQKTYNRKRNKQENDRVSLNLNLTLKSFMSLKVEGTYTNKSSLFFNKIKLLFYHLQLRLFWLVQLPYNLQIVDGHLEMTYWIYQPLLWNDDNEQ